MADTATIVSIAGLHIQAGMIAAVGTLAAGCGGCWAKIRSEARETRKEQAEARKAEKSALEAELQPIRTAIATFKSKDQLKEDREALQRDIDDVRHDLRNERARIDALDTKRQEADRWAAKVDLTITNIEKGQERIEHAVERNHRETLEAMKVWADQFSASIREIRNVNPR